MTRRHDPERRQRIIEATIRVVMTRGIAGVSHRAVAAEAGVPLGSTTYHFAGLDDLLVAALEQVCLGPRAAGGDWRRHLGPDVPLVDGLVRYLEECLRQDPGRVRLEYELYLAALRREALRPLAAAWQDEMAGLLAGRTRDPTAARALVALVDGLMLQHLLTGRPFDREGARAALARAVGPGPARTARREPDPRTAPGGAPDGGTGSGAASAPGTGPAPES